MQGEEKSGRRLRLDSRMREGGSGGRTAESRDVLEARFFIWVKVGQRKFLLGKKVGASVKHCVPQKECGFFELEPVGPSPSLAEKQKATLLLHLVVEGRLFFSSPLRFLHPFFFFFFRGGGLRLRR